MTAPGQTVRIMINPKSGLGVSMRILLQTFSEVWDCDGRLVTYQLTKSAEDGRAKARQALRDGVDTLIVVGGDGVINSIGSELLNTPVTLGVIPTGSGNGFARHFGIPLNPGKAI
jgi:diacylglycerol kinase (ATP)